MPTAQQGHDPEALPLLSHALRATWQRREDRTLTVAGYVAAGGVRNTICITAETHYGKGQCGPCALRLRHYSRAEG
ncbi:hypothetical protein GCM10015535_61220 [Streptomyces gelaticus]|uniref:Novel STAND NTPase 1 domain-containing protein n=1 Tax=Streptomyces gelaticus TaxID=285446 RepID=A0ABQ2W9V7_9ACTN|nr:hypothetical protein GCM10015535_61220 [Streptomyces gelaticus]